MSRRPIERILFVRPPAHLWPILNESDNFLMPLAFPYIAAYLRQQQPHLHIRIVDCLPLEIGWSSLRQLIADEKPDLICTGEMIVYMKEGMRALQIAREVNPDVITVCGGHFHSHMPEYTLETYPFVDYVVMYEGEHAFDELVTTLNTGGDLADARSLAYRDDRGQTRINTPMPLADLDELPSPAYDLMPVQKYSPFGKLWPRAITIQGSRGCPHNCDFCSWAALEGEHVMDAEGNLHVVPVRRQKSVARTMAEIDQLYHQYGVRYLFWVDATWNYDDEWLEELSTEIIRGGYDLGWWAFVRPDLILDQERTGLLRRMVRAGLRHVLLGGERPAKAELELMGKGNLDQDALLQASQMLKRNHPQVFRQATFVTGIRSETRESIERLAQYSRDAQLDFAAYHPIMAYPGTPMWDHACAEGWIEEQDFSNFDMFFPVMSSEHLTRAEVSSLTSKITKDWVGKRPLRYAAGMLSSVPIRRQLHWWFAYSIGRVMFNDVTRSVRGEKRFEGFGGINKLWEPPWYND